jgi:D-glycero-D-manno-heptose 1,7-bisphosphate phosphatase
MGISSVKDDRDRVRAVFVDRDGVLNRAVIHNGQPYPPTTVETLEILPGVPQAVHQLRESGYLVIGATNQPDVARGTQSRQVVETMNARLMAAMPVIEILVCYDDDDDCPRRKPNPGLLWEAAQLYDIDLSASFMIGDRWRDIEAGRRAGCRTIFLDLGYNERRPDPPANYSTVDLPTAVAWILFQAPNGDKRYD